jgi:hypothetical protein
MMPSSVVVVAALLFIATATPRSSSFGVYAFAGFYLPQLQKNIVLYLQLINQITCQTLVRSDDEEGKKKKKSQKEAPS